MWYEPGKAAAWDIYSWETAGHKYTAATADPQVTPDPLDGQVYRILGQPSHTRQLLKVGSTWSTLPRDLGRYKHRQGHAGQTETLDT
jgi:hypothetical protein